VNIRKKNGKFIQRFELENEQLNEELTGSNWRSPKLYRF
jgi:hypothetical protein